MSTTFLYTLNCPFTGQIRYVGKSDNPFKRFKKHLLTCELESGHKANWIRSLKAKGWTPTMDLLDEVPVSEWQFWEREYIRVFRMINIPLTNTTEGGEGFLVGKHSEETIQKMRRAHTGKKMSLTAREKMSLSRLGKKASFAARENNRLSQAGKTRSLETREKLSGTNNHFFGKTHTAEAREKIRLFNRGKKASIVTRKKMRLSQLGRKMSLSTREKMSQAAKLRELVKRNARRDS